MDDFKQTPQWRFGQRAETYLRERLKEVGHLVINLSAIEEGGAPAARYANGKIVLPDLDAVGPLVKGFVEVKAKTAATFSRCTGTKDHGISQRLAWHYCEVENSYGRPVFVAVVEMKTGLVLFVRAIWFQKKGRRYDGDRMDRGGMVFLERSSFTVMESLSFDPNGDQFRLPFDWLRFDQEIAQARRWNAPLVEEERMPWRRA